MEQPNLQPVALLYNMMLKASSPVHQRPSKQKSCGIWGKNVIQKKLTGDFQTWHRKGHLRYKEVATRKRCKIAKGCPSTISSIVKVSCCSNQKKHRENCKTLPFKHCIGCQCVKLFFLKDVTITTVTPLTITTVTITGTFYPNL